MILDSIENKRKILVKFLEICTLEGFTERALSLAVEAAEIEVKYKNIIFENGCLDLIRFYIAEENQKILLKINQTNDFEGFKIREKIKFALYTFFENQKNHQLALQRLQNFYLDPKNFLQIECGARPILLAFKHVGEVSDFIWYAIGDKSTDFNFYTKRLTLAKIILKTFRVFLKDKSADLEATKSFIDLQIEQVMRFEKIKFRIKEFSKKAQEKSCDFFYDENGEIKTLTRIVKDFPFVRLFNK